MIRQMSDYVVRCLPGFWRIAKACMDGKYLKRDSATGSMRASSRPVSACRQMACDIMKLYINTISQFFTLSDMVIVTSPSANGVRPAVPAFVPTGTTVLAAAYYAEKVSAEVSDCANEMMGIDVGKEATQITRAMLDSLRWRMLEVVSTTWLRGELCRVASSNSQTHRRSIFSRTGSRQRAARRARQSILTW